MRKGGLEYDTRSSKSIEVGRSCRPVSTGASDPPFSGVTIGVNSYITPGAASIGFKGGSR
jgi:hypothetical protein